MSTWSTGNGIFPGLNALAARCSRTAESFPPLKSRTGRSDSAATSRMMKMASDSRRSRWPNGCSTGLTRAVTDPPVLDASEPAVVSFLGGAEGGGGVHGASQIMTILVMYTKACIRTGVKRRRRAPETARSPFEEGEGSVAETNVSDQQSTAEDLAVVSAGFESAPASAVIRWAIESFGDSLVLAASFEDIVLIDLVTKVAPDVEVVFLDTEAHFPETLAFVDDMRERYGLNLTVTKPGPEAAAYPCGSDQCCQFRKVEPLRRALAGKRAWLTSLKRSDGPTRADAPIVSWDAGFGLVKVNPLATWTEG